MEAVVLSHFDNKYYKIGVNPQKLIIFIHGYNGSPEAIDYAIQSLREKLHNAVLVVPRAPFECEKDVNNLQWLSFYQVDPKAEFRNPDSSVEKIFGIFDALAPSFEQTAAQMNDFVDEMQQLFGIEDKNTYIAGFSQGAMIALYTALSRRQNLGGCVMLSGIVAGRPLLEKNIVSTPKLLILHGEDDATVQYKTLPTTLKWLDNQNISYKCLTYKGLAHRMNDEEMQQLTEFVEQN